MPSKDHEVATITEDEIYQKFRQKKNIPTKTSPTSILLNKCFGFDNSEKQCKKNTALQNILEGSPKRSPRILITRAFSEESDKTSRPNTPRREMIKTHSSSATTLIERKWRQLRNKVRYYKGHLHTK